MKARLIGPVAIALSLAFTINTNAQHYYVIIGTVSSPVEVEEFTDYINNQYLDSSTTNTDDMSSVYYVMEAPSKDEAEFQVKNFHTQFRSRNNVQNQTVAAPENRITIEDFSLIDQETLNEKAANGLTESPSPGEVIPSIGYTSESNMAPEQTIASNETEIVAESEENLPVPKGKFFKFVVANPDGAEISASIHHVDLTRGRDIASYRVNSYIDIAKPANPAMTLVCGIFGYKLVEKMVDYSNPSLTPGAYEDERGAWVVPYELRPLETGDVSVMYNVTFHKDAVIMLPHSKGDLDQLVNMMNENPNYNIVVHAHCNGKKSRKIIATGDSKNYFNITGSKEIIGSPKEFTTLRAEAIRSYMVDRGIDPKRIKTFGWGGSYMLVNEFSPNAKLNDRIEIEIKKH